MWLSHSVPVPCGLQVLHHPSQQSGVGIVGYKFRSTNVHEFIFGPRSLEIGAPHVPHSVRMLQSFLMSCWGLGSLCVRTVFCNLAEQSRCWSSWSGLAIFRWWFGKTWISVSFSSVVLWGRLCRLTGCWVNEVSRCVSSSLADSRCLVKNWFSSELAPSRSLLSVLVTVRGATCVGTSCRKRRKPEGS